MKAIDLTLFECADELARRLEAEGDKVRIINPVDQKKYEQVGFEFVAFVDGKMMMRLDKKIRTQRRAALGKAKDKASEVRLNLPSRGVDNWVDQIGDARFEDITRAEAKVMLAETRRVCYAKGYGDGRMLGTRGWL